MQEHSYSTKKAKLDNDLIKTVERLKKKLRLARKKNHLLQVQLHKQKKSKEKLKQLIKEYKEISTKEKEKILNCVNGNIFIKKISL